MKRLLAAVPLVMATAGSAMAADMPLKAAPTPIYSWTGLYVGINAGESIGRSSVDFSQLGAPGAKAGPDIDLSSLTAGGQIGYNWQTGIWVLGVEADIDWRNRGDRTTYLAPTTLGVGGAPFLSVAGDSAVFNAEQNWLGTVRGRLGTTYGTDGSGLFYVTGGLAYGNVKHSVFEVLVAPGTANNRFISDSDTKSGWTIGGGTEFRFAGPWSAAIEYLYVDLGRSTLNFPTQTIGGTVFAADTTTFHDTAHLFRAKLNYKFGL